MSADLTLKRGDAFSYAAAVTDAQTGEPVSIAGWDIASQLRNEATDALVTDLVVSARDDAAGTYVLSAGDTTGFALARLVMDIEYRIGGLPISSRTLTVDVVRDVTRPG